MFEHRIEKPKLPPTFGWWLVLCLVGLDYFSTLAYLPSIAVEAAGALAPLAAAGVVTVTLLLAVPVYWYVVGRSPRGHGATGLIDERIRGWLGKLLLLILLGFVATDFVITRTLSVADASLHLLANPVWKAQVDQVASQREAWRASLPPLLQGSFFDFWTEQIILTVGLSLLCFLFWAFLQTGFTQIFLRIGAGVTVIYMLLTAIIILIFLVDLSDHRDLFGKWWFDQVPNEKRLNFDLIGANLSGVVALLAILSFPQMALGLSGFELSMASAPLLHTDETDNPEHPRGRIRRARLLILAAALIMGVYILGSSLITTIYIDEEKLIGETPTPVSAQHRALAYLAHGDRLADGRMATDICPYFGPAFGTIYDISTVAILCLAGASSALGIREVVPYYLARYGMQLHWAQRTGVIMHLFNVVVLVVTLGFRASVSAQQWAYATSVLILLTSAALAALLDVRARWRGTYLRPVVSLPFFLIALFFLGFSFLTMFRGRGGLSIAMGFVGVTIATAILSRWIRSTELRFEGFTFADEKAKARWEEMCRLDFQILVPHRPGMISLKDKEADVRTVHRLGHDVPIIFVEVTRGDPSDFMNAPLLRIDEEEGREIIRISRCASVAHVLAAICMAFHEVGRPPEIHFGWSEDHPMAGNLSFLFLGEGNIPWLVESLLRKAEPNAARRPRVVVG